MLLSSFIRTGISKMRRNDRLVASKEGILSILKNCSVASLGLNDGGRPYIVPMSFAVKWSDKDVNPTFYFHAATQGRKNDVIKSNGNACVSLVGNMSVKNARPGMPCSASMNYESVFAEGKIELIEDQIEREEGLVAILEKYGQPTGPLKPVQMAKTAVFKLSAESISGKRSIM